MRRLPPPLALAAVIATAGACAPPSASRADQGVAASAETRPPNSHYKPAFAGQTRAPALKSSVQLEVQPIVHGLQRPWAFEFLPDGRLIITEIAGQMRLAVPNGPLSPPIAGVPKVLAEGQGGLLDIAVDPDFARNQTIFFSYAEAREGGNGTTLARARLVDGPSPRLEDVQVIFRQQPAWNSRQHFGSRIVFAPDGTLFLTLGERSICDARVHAQDLSVDLGKIVRLNKDGTIPKDNPFVGRAEARPEIWTYGHRNVQAAALRPGDHQLWTIEHGPRGGDIVLSGDRVVGEEWLLHDLGHRIRDVNQGPDGAIYVATDGGSILRLAPKR